MPRKTRFVKNAQKYFGKFECTHSTVSASLHVIMQSFLMFTYLFLLFWRTVIERERNTENNSICQSINEAIEHRYALINNVIGHSHACFCTFHIFDALLCAKSSKCQFTQHAFC